ncbi:OpgC domain-containing protein [Rhodovulum sp. DZ06]|uniref:OpgC domain-containing protein n=1 Tax=Rhodovulum sp. DZ06 TaxID=3425126 RepID=UPI003D34BEE9
MRYTLVDGMRGHLLLGMMYAHMSFSTAVPFASYFHHAKWIGLYDAEFFIPISGFLIGLLCFGTDRPRSFGRFAVTRLRVIYGYMLICHVPFLLDGLTGVDWAESPGAGTRLLVESLLLQKGGYYADILIIYICCFLVCGGLSALFGADLRKWCAGSALIYAASQVEGSAGLFGLVGGFQPFDIAAWQFLFVIFVALGGWSPALRRRALAAPAWAAPVLAIGGLWLTASAAHGLPPFNLHPALNGFDGRMELTPFYLVRVLAGCLAITAILVGRDALTAPARAALRWYFSLGPLRRVGRWSIQAFTLHVLLMAAAIQVDWTALSTPLRAAALVGAVALFFGLMQLYALWREAPSDAASGAPSGAEAASGARSAGGRG